MKSYLVKPFSPHDVTVCVPASKSILNRALLLAAFADSEVFLRCGAFGEDTRALIECLQALGIPVSSQIDGLRVVGCGGKPPCAEAELNVKSAGTAARFLPPILAFCGGGYSFRSSEQMQKRPMSILGTLASLGATIDYEDGIGRFPFRLRSNGIAAERCSVDTNASTQYASGLLLAAACGTRPFTVRLTGDRTDGSYIRMTLSLLPSFGCEFSRSGEEITVFPRKHAPCAFFETEPDLSAACYFYALSLLFGVKVTVRGVSSKTAQGDFSFLRLLEARGVRLTDTPQGLLADGSEVGPFRGFDENMHDFSDQALTVAALAPFASSPSRISGVGHIRFQECDRIAAIQKNLTAIGVPVTVSEDAITVFPAPVRGGRIETFSDHRVAMAFTLIGLKTGGIEIADPDCTGKTFEGYFDLITSLTD